MESKVELVKSAICGNCRLKGVLFSMASDTCEHCAIDFERATKALYNSPTPKAETQQEKPWALRTNHEDDKQVVCPPKPTLSDPSPYNDCPCDNPSCIPVPQPEPEQVHNENEPCPYNPKLKRCGVPDMKCSNCWEKINPKGAESMRGACKTLAGTQPEPANEEIETRTDAELVTLTQEKVKDYITSEDLKASLSNPEPTLLLSFEELLEFQTKWIEDGGAFTNLFSDICQAQLAKAKPLIEAPLRAEIAELRERVDAWENLEAEVCPEDVGLNEYIQQLIDWRIRAKDEYEKQEARIKELEMQLKEPVELMHRRGKAEAADRVIEWLDNGEWQMRELRKLLDQLKGKE